ncbi:NAD-dependent malic enzyme [Monocercomonoides exilis]|uniref:NAD-dependent malic enzyme n=1 Tax=Monocercomonoides exilis TaxID=2049356 RepID=UPI00355A026C|nr:NAD-dependent malic enzyme [Monocercomonoides exilis]|eukprot:MONOS_5594.1-p1 / transcript=MONOS_5594.1 / gene=MONOS_5594 / organism=Monocercomonoides_exilis_PA203 / gene_product=NAD-dependent malic enzyme / transcript_product=NAD-dependent malic enzyme / location=Mono_scaffold00164:98850-100502(+) / protein_length=551 / sequence_SO=supercontig / SO=protein_coding / is_pseudo=false
MEGLKGDQLLQEPTLSIGESFSIEKRKELGIHGLMPSRVLSPELQEKRILAEFDAETDPLKKFLLLSDLYDRNVHLYYFIILRNFAKMAPFIYTPHVGTYCSRFHEFYRPKRALYYTIEDAGKCDEITAAWPMKKVDVVVITDGGRILGLGDLGSNGIGIPIGKLALYCAGAGSDPRCTLPVQVDVGTTNMTLRQNPLYMGLDKDRVRGEKYHAFIEEVLMSIHKRWPEALIQFEDFGIENAFELLVRWRDRLLCFNDDIQGTGAVALTAVINACRARGGTLKDLMKDRIVISGAGSAGIGIADAIVAGLVNEGIPAAEARRIFWITNSKGLLGKGKEYSPQQMPFVRDDMENGMPLLELVKTVKPTILLGVSGVAGIFTEEIVRLVAASAERPIIMPMSNPTIKAECTLEQVMDWTEGRAIFASGSPFEDVTKEIKGEMRTVRGNQCNNMYIFPALGLAASKAHATKVTDGMFYRSSLSLAQLVPEEDVKKGILFPQLSQTRQFAQRIATDVIEQGIKEKVIDPARLPCKESEIFEWIGSTMYRPEKFF